MKVIFNIEFDNYDAQSLLSALAFLDRPFRCQTSKTSTDGKAMLAAIEIDNGWDASNIAWFLCGLLRQEAAACYAPQCNTGWIAGPHTGSYAPFDLSKFWIPEGWR